MRYFIEIAYDGTAFHGWQIQDNESSVQQTLEQGLKYKLGLNDRVTGCGRTDSGVHARRFYAHFDLSVNLDNVQKEQAVHELNSFLPDAIAVKRIFCVNSDAHARFDAVSRTYKYYIHQIKDPFCKAFAWNYRRKLDVVLMNKAAEDLMQYNDFTSFAKLHSDVKTNFCKVTQANWIEENGRLIFTITADRFLRNMVRAIVGTLVEVGFKKISPEGFKKVIESLDRGRAGMSVPACGLFLENIDYDWDKILLREG